MSEPLAADLVPPPSRVAVEPRLSALSERHVHMALAPLPTVTALALEALGERRGSPVPWYRAVRACLDADDVALLGPVASNGGISHIPDCLLPRPPSFAPSFEEQLEGVVATPADVVAADLAADGLLGSPWAPMALEPRRWLSAYAATMRRAWGAVKPLWERAAPLLENEVDRVGVALARGSFDVLLDGLYPNGRVRDDRWYVGRPEHAVAIAPGMVIEPIVGGPRWAFLGDRDGVVSDLSYPLPGARRLTSPELRVANRDALAALLGGPRAEILRRLDRAATAGALAESMRLVPSAISHHVHTLEQAGLVRRTRRGRYVLVHRTTRGTALVNLYDG